MILNAATPSAYGGTGIPACDGAMYSSTQVSFARAIGHGVPCPITDKNVCATKFWTGSYEERVLA
jgi:hypothetical protein